MNHTKSALRASPHIVPPDVLLRFGYTPSGGIEFDSVADVLRFSTTASGGGAQLPALSIDTSQNVGIGTDTPSSLLHVNGAFQATNIDGIIGANAPAAGTFTAGVFGGVLSVDDTTASTSGTTGSIHTDGGLGVVKSVAIGGSIGLGGTAPAMSIGIYADGETIIGDNSPYYLIGSDRAWSKTSAFTNFGTGFHASPRVGGNNTGDWTTSAVQLRGFNSRPILLSGSAGNMTGVADFYGQAISNSGSMVLANAYGMFLEQQAAGATGNYYFGFSAADNTDPTGGGGAAAGRIAIEVAGTLRYIPYY